MIESTKVLIQLINECVGQAVLLTGILATQTGEAKDKCLLITLSNAKSECVKRSDDELDYVINEENINNLPCCSEA